jgi:hypothetical protein
VSLCRHQAAALYLLRPAFAVPLPPSRVHKWHTSLTLVRFCLYRRYADFFIQTKQDAPDVFLPAAILQSLLLSEDEAIAVSARDCLRVVLQMGSPTVDSIVIQSGMESAFIVQHFVRLYAALPPHFDGDEIQVHTMEWSESEYVSLRRAVPYSVLHSNSFDSTSVSRTLCAPRPEFLTHPNVRNTDI